MSATFKVIFGRISQDIGLMERQVLLRELTGFDILSSSQTIKEDKVLYNI